MGHLDLQFSRLGEIVTGHTEAARRHLLDRAVFRIAVGFQHVARRIFAALAGIALAADAVHRDRQGFMGFFADRAVGHGAGLEPFDDRVHRLDFLDGNRLRRVFERHQTAQCRDPLRLIVDQPGVFFERPVIVVAAGLLQQMNRPRVEQMELAILAVLVLAVDFQRVAVQRIGRKRPRMLLLRFPRHFFQTDAADSRRRPGKILIDQLLAQPDRFENLRAAVGLDGRDAHLRHHFDDAFVDGFVVAFDGVMVTDVLAAALVDHVVQTFVSQIGIDRLHAVTEQQTEMVHFARLAGLQHQADPGARAGADQMMMQAGRGEQRRDRRVGAIDAFVGKNQDRRAIGNRRDPPP